MRRKNWFWGVFFVLAAVLIVAWQVTSFATLGFWTILAAVFLAACLISSLVKLNFVGTLLSGALLYLVLQTPLGWMPISPWLLILAALFAGGGLSMIFKRRPRYGSYGGYGGHGGWRRVEAAQSEWDEHAAAEHQNYMRKDENDDDNRPYGKVSFGSSSRYLHSTALEYGQFSASFGAMEVYFDQATLAPGGAEVFCDASFGAVRLIVPSGWVVEDRIHTSVGGVDNDASQARPGPNAPHLVLTGNASFGAVEVVYV